MAEIRSSLIVSLMSVSTLFLFACGQQAISPTNSPLPTAVVNVSSVLESPEIDALLASPSANIPGVLIFVSDISGEHRIGMLDLRDNTIKTFTSSSIDTDPSLSSDNKKIVFITNRDRNPYYDIYIMNIDGSQQRPIKDDNDMPIRSNFAPVLSNDGRYVAFHSDRDLSGNMDIYIIDILDGRSQRLTNHPAMDINPSWSPDGKRIVFSSDRDGDFDLYVINPDGSDLRKLFDNPEHSDLFPKYSPNGQYIVFTTQFYLGGVDSHIALIRADGSEYRQITQGRGQFRHATWVGNRALVFSGRSNAYDKWQIFITSLENPNPIRLTWHQANFYNPSLVIIK